MKKILIILGLIFILTSNNYSEIIKIGKLKALKNNLKIRFIPEVYNKAMAELYLANEKISIKEQYLLPEQSLLLNSNRFLDANDQHYSNIIEAEKKILKSYVIEYKQNINPEKFANYLLNKYNFLDVAEPYFIDEPLSTNDPFLSYQNYLSKIKAFDAWNYYKGDNSIVIAISDNGVNQNHEDLSDNIYINTNEIPNNNKDDDGNGYIDDYNGYNFAYYDEKSSPGNTFYYGEDHGNLVAGIAAATTNNNIGIAGIGYNCKFLPIKTAINNKSSIVYGYQSIIFAALRGCKVINCSWGTPKRFSQIDQSIIDFAVAKGMVVVAAGGNQSNSTKSKTDLYYPAGYKGVLGVGEVDQSDYVTENTMLGPGCKIFAPGTRNYTTNADGNYEFTSGGTSFASPVVAGAVAIAYGYYSKLNPMQIISFIRQCTDDVSTLNPTYSKIVAGRINMSKIFSLNPYDIPGFEFEDMQTYIDSKPVKKLYPGDIVDLSIKLHNYLGNADNLTFKLSVVEDYSNSVEVVNSTISNISSTSNSDLNLSGFKVKIKQYNNNKVFIRLDISNSNNYSDFLIIRFTPTSSVTDFANDVISFSLEDRGKFGFGGIYQNREGIGFNFKNYGNQLYKGGIMATLKNERLVSSFNGWGNYDSDFRYSSNNSRLTPTSIIINDSDAISEEFIGLEIKQDVIIPSEYSNIARINVKVKNTTNKSLFDVGVGYFIDWDLGFDSDSNRVRYFPEAIPSEFGSIKASAEIAEYVGKNYLLDYNSQFPVFGCISATNEQNTFAQSAGLNYSTVSNFDKILQISTLNSNNTIQYNDIDDISMVSGVLFTGELKPQQEKSFIFCIGGAENRDKLAINLKQAVLGIPITYISNDGTINEIKFYPNPTNNFIYIDNITASSQSITIFDIYGNKTEISIIDNYINLSSFSSGIYYTIINNRLYKIMKN